MLKNIKQTIIQKSYETRSGLTALYIVVFASLLFTIIAVGFVTIIMSEVSQTVNDELSQSAYDSALAGIEDAKLAIMKCQNGNTSPYCSTITQDEIGNISDDCLVVARILDRPIDENNSVLISDTSSSGSNTASSLETLQAYTCVTIRSKLSDYRSYLSSTDTDTVRLVPLRAADGASQITGIRISWYASTDNNEYVYRNVDPINKYVSFYPVNQGISAPPTIAVQLIQTASSFSLKSSEIDYTVGERSDRGTIFLVPTNINDMETKDSFIVAANNHIANYGTSNSQVGGVINPSVSVPSGFLKANDKTQTNVPYVITCETTPGSEFACSATIQIPQPVNSSSSNPRSNETAMLVVSMPYDQPSTDFAVELCSDDGGYCKDTVDFENAQYAIDSTGRANDVYNRVEARVELDDVFFPYPEYAVHLTGNGDTFIKHFWASVNGCQYSNDGDIGSATCSGGLNGH